MSPLLFILFINDICNISENFNTILFADDTNLVFSGSNYNELIESCNTEMRKFVTWSNANRLSINTEKTKYVTFATRKIPSPSLPILMNSEIIEQVKQIKFLGVHVDQNLNFKPHTNSICAKISKSIGIFYSIRTKVSKPIFFMLYYSLVYPYLTYCNLLWGKTYRCHLKPIEILQKRCLRIMNNSEYRDHTRPLFFSNKLLQLGDIYKFRLATFMYKSPVFVSSFSRIHSHNTRDRESLRPQFQRLTVSQKSLSFQGPNLWNEIPAEIKDVDRVTIFKKQLKEYLISKYE